MVIYHAPPGAWEKTSGATPEEFEAGMKEWFVWKDRIGDKLVDFGSPLAPGTRIKPDGSTEQSTKDVTGYSIVQADNLDEAKSLLEGHPHLTWTDGCDIEVHELTEPGS